MPGTIGKTGSLKSRAVNTYQSGMFLLSPEGTFHPGLPKEEGTARKFSSDTCQSRIFKLHRTGPRKSESGSPGPVLNVRGSVKVQANSLQVKQCFYAPVGIMGYTMNFLLDTGASCSAIDVDWLNSLPEDKRLEIKPTDVDVTQVGGDTLPVQMQVDLTLDIAGAKVQITVFVASLGENGGILGLDILDLPEVDFSLKEKWISVAGNRASLMKAAGYQCSRMTVAENTVIPPEHAVWVKGRIDKKRWSPDLQYGIVEPSKTFITNTGMYVDRAVVPTSKPGIMVINTGQTEQSLKPGSTLAVLQPCQNITSASSGEETRKVDAAELLPDHLSTLLDGVHSDLSSDQRKQLASLLLEFKDCFVGPGEALGSTSIVEHTINTGDAKPIRLPPRVFHKLRRRNTMKK